MVPTAQDCSSAGLRQGKGRASMSSQGSVRVRSLLRSLFSGGTTTHSCARCGSTTHPMIFTAAIHSMAYSAGLRSRIPPRWPNSLQNTLIVNCLLPSRASTGKAALLLIGTTNLDTQRLAIWNIGEIASSNHAGALQLFRQILLASTAVPGLFPPVRINVAASRLRARRVARRRRSLNAGFSAACQRVLPGPR